MNKQKGFTIVELLGVVIILGILTIMGIRRFGNIGTERYHAERCFSKIYGETSKSFHEIAFEKVLDTQKPANDMMLSFSQSPDQLSKQINYEDGTHTPETINFSDIDGCQKKGKFELKLANSLRITLLSGLKNKNNTRGIQIKGAFTGEVKFQLCSTQDTPSHCQEFSKILFDSRVGTIKRSTCKYYNDDKQTCKERSANLD